MAGILIKLIKRMKKINPATGERLLTMDKANSPSAAVSVTNLERNSKNTGLLCRDHLSKRQGSNRIHHRQRSYPRSGFQEELKISWIHSDNLLLPP
jgi:hypothetical protein